MQEHIKKKKKIEKAKKKAIQEHLNKSRSDKASMTSTISSRGSSVQARTGIKRGCKSTSLPRPCLEGRGKSSMVKKLPSANQRRAKLGAPTRAKPKSPQNTKVTSGLKKSRKPLKKAIRREKVKGKVSTGDSLKGVYKE